MQRPSIYTFGKFCRVCTSKRNLKYLGDAHESSSMLNKLTFCVPEVVSGQKESIPNYACEVCFNAIIMLYEFKTRVIKNNNLLRKCEAELRDSQNLPGRLVKRLLKEELVEVNPELKLTIVEDSSELLSDDIITTDTSLPREQPDENIETELISVNPETDNQDSFTVIDEQTIEMDSEVENPCYLCMICNCTFNDFEVFNNHAEEHKRSEFICEICGAKMSSLDAFNAHALTHSTFQSPPYSCHDSPKSKKQHRKHADNKRRTK